METERFEERCISYLYNEMNDEERLKFQHLIASDRESNLKFNSIRRAQAILARIPRVDPPGTVDTAGIRAEKSSTPAVAAAESMADSNSDADSDADVRTYRKQGPTSRTAGTPAAGSKPAPEAKKGNSSEPAYPRLSILPGGPWSRAVSAAAAVLFGLLIFGAVSGLQVRWDSDGFAMSMSLFGESGAIDNTPPAPTYLLQDETLEQLRKQQEELFSEIMAAEREQQRLMLLETLSEYAEAIETRRMIDMQLIGHELADFQQQTNQQLSQTDRIIYQLIETLSYNQELQDEQQ
ncbi:MAG: hypothetical protein LC662_03320 [Rhodothermaceae bacterium]|nr:hypothetical protein [Rhodothermaceae bacterium]